MPVSKIKSNLQFITKESKPEMIGVCPLGSEHGAWFKKQHVENHIKKLENELDFWRELLQQF